MPTAKKLVKNACVDGNKGEWKKNDYKIKLLRQKNCRSIETNRKK